MVEKAKLSQSEDRCALVSRQLEVESEVMAQIRDGGNIVASEVVGARQEAVRLHQQLTAREQEIERLNSVVRGVQMQRDNGLTEIESIRKHELAIEDQLMQSSKRIIVLNESETREAAATAASIERVKSDNGELRNELQVALSRIDEVKGSHERLSNECVQLKESLSAAEAEVQSVSTQALRREEEFGRAYDAMESRLMDRLAIAESRAVEIHHLGSDSEAEHEFCPDIDSSALRDNSRETSHPVAQTAAGSDVMSHTRWAEIRYNMRRYYVSNNLPRMTTQEDQRRA